MFDDSFLISDVSMAAAFSNSSSNSSLSNTNFHCLSTFIQLFFYYKISIVNFLHTKEQIQEVILAQKTFLDIGI